MGDYCPPIYRGSTAFDNNLLSDFDLKTKLERLTIVRETKILFLARLERAKGVFETVDAVKILSDKGLPVSLSIAGDGSVKQEIEGYAAGLALPDNVISFSGYVRDKEKVSAFKEHDIYCFPITYGEGLPNSMLEAMAFGMPLITRPPGGIYDMFESGKMGYITESKKT